MNRRFPPLSSLCKNCLTREDDSDIEKPCPWIKNGRHVMIQAEYWKAEVVVDFFDVKSERKAICILSEMHIPQRAYISARKLTEAELKKLRSGK